MARFCFVDDDSSVESPSSNSSSDGSSTLDSLEYSNVGLDFLADNYLKSDEESISFGESSIDVTLHHNDGDAVNGMSNEEVPFPSPPVAITIAVAVVDIVPP